MRRTVRWLALAATLAVMLLIFYLSAQDGAASGALSNAVADRVQTTAVQQVTPGWFSGNFNANIRKWAHVYVYCALGICVGTTVCIWRPKWTARRQALAAAGICVVYAAGDELHQYFVPGRAMLAEDVVIDAAGFLPCLLLICLLFWLWRRCHPER